MTNHPLLNLHPAHRRGRGASVERPAPPHTAITGTANQLPEKREKAPTIGRPHLLPGRAPSWPARDRQLGAL